mmetsp:Transcript_607/g.1995  ORF Transcript_607/g.1995 Transcript_607/m.1995 type:complete len:242 (-) Transcript_607:677-1402(-)
MVLAVPVSTRVVHVFLRSTHPSTLLLVQLVACGLLHPRLDVLVLVRGVVLLGERAWGARGGCGEEGDEGCEPGQARRHQGEDAPGDGGQDEAGGGGEREGEGHGRGQGRGRGARAGRDGEPACRQGPDREGEEEDPDGAERAEPGEGRGVPGPGEGAAGTGGDRAEAEGDGGQGAPRQREPPGEGGGAAAGAPAAGGSAGGAAAAGGGGPEAHQRAGGDAAHPGREVQLPGGRDRDEDQEA